MRAREILQEDYNQSLESDLTNLIVGAKGTGAKQIRTKDVADQLYAMGYSIDVNSLIPMLGRNPAVLNATPEMINMTEPEVSATGPAGPTQDNAARVKDMASKATEIG